MQRISTHNVPPAIYFISCSFWLLPQGCRAQLTSQTQLANLRPAPRSFEGSSVLRSVSPGSQELITWSECFCGWSPCPTSPSAGTDSTSHMCPFSRFMSIFFAVRAYPMSILATCNRHGESRAMAPQSGSQLKQCIFSEMWIGTQG